LSVAGLFLCVVISYLCFKFGLYYLVMNKNILLLLILYIFSFQMFGEDHYCFRVYLKDKGNTLYSVSQPEVFLSKTAIELRTKNAVPIDKSDLPISPICVDVLRSTGARVVVESKWLSTVVMESIDSTVVERLRKLPNVDSVKWVWKGEHKIIRDTVADQISSFPSDLRLDNRYGYAFRQIKMLNGISLHKSGFQGEGMRVAVIDAGFRNVNKIAAFDSMCIIGTHNVVCPDESVFVGDEHGAKVLSCLAADIPGYMVGTAPKASYLLIKSEDSNSEYPIEEDYWAAAAEYADSVGVNVISSSLGYYTFDSESLSYHHSDLNGHETQISRAANMAASKGILVFCSAGNEGNGDWEKITFPADAEEVYTVGAVDEKKKRSSFSSLGLIDNGRIKPDGAALGTNSCVIDPTGEIAYPNGTSFSTPILAGMGICLWQSLPWLNNKEIIKLLHQTSNQYNHPDTALGYGIPDIYKAYKWGLKNARQRLHRNK